MGCSDSTPVDRFRIKIPLPSNLTGEHMRARGCLAHCTPGLLTIALAGFGQLTSMNLYRCVEMLKKCKDGDDRVMLENRAAGTWAAAPFHTNNPMSAASRGISQVYSDAGNTCLSWLNFYRRCVRWGAAYCLSTHTVSESRMGSDFLSHRQTSAQRDATMWTLFHTYAG